MKILIVSDTHGHDSNLKRVLKKNGTPDALIHLGDSENTEDHLKKLALCPVYMVAGNCDGFTNLPLTRIVELDGCRILLTHGHPFYVSVDLEKLVEEAKINGCSVAMFGHTHRPLIDQSDPSLTVLNPGSLSYPRQDGHMPSYILMETEGKGKARYSLCFL